MLINAGKYVGTGKLKKESDKVKRLIECEASINIHDHYFEIEGVLLSSGTKNSNFTIRINNNAGSNLENTTIEYQDYKITGALNSIETYVTGVFITEYRTEILGVTVSEIANGYRVSGTIIKNHNLMFDLKLISTSPTAAKSNVVRIA